MQRALNALALLVFLAPSATLAADGKKIHHTYYQPPKVKPADPMRVSPAYEVPQDPEKFTWKVVGTIGGKTVYPSAVPVYDFTDNHRGRVGEIPIGTEVKLDFFRPVGSVHYYQIPWEGPGPKLVWISGLYIAPSGTAGAPDANAK